jgi:hypothetical protein
VRGYIKVISKIEWYGKIEQYINVSIESRYTPLNEKTVNKTLMIAMNYLMENMEKEKQEESAE